jgi:hypothetical protein
MSRLECRLIYHLRLTSVAVHQPPGGESCCSERTLAPLADVPADRPCQSSLPSVRRDRPDSDSFIVADRDQFATVRRKKQFADHGDVSPSFDDQTGCAFRPEGAWLPNRRGLGCSLDTVLRSRSISHWLCRPALFLDRARVEAIWISHALGGRSRWWALLQCRRALRCDSRRTSFCWYCARRSPVPLVSRSKRWRMRQGRDGCLSRCAAAGLAFLRAFRDPWGLGRHRCTLRRGESLRGFRGLWCLRECGNLHRGGKYLIGCSSGRWIFLQGWRRR